MTERGPDGAVRRSIRRHLLGGGIVAALLVFGLGGWAAVAPLSSAVVANGRLVVEGKPKVIQHSDGGIVAEIAVHDGDVVAEGDLLLRLDDTITKANLAIVEQEIDQLEARRARLTAERDGKSAVDWPTELPAPNADQEVRLAAERRLFAARAASLEGQRNQLTQRISQTEEEIVGLLAQKKAKEDELVVIAAELKDVEALYKTQLVTLQRVNALRREKIQIEGTIGYLVAETARARARITETKEQLLQLDQENLSQILQELREVEAGLATRYERRTAARDKLDRIEIRAPQGGVVHQLAVNTVGSVVSPAQTLMLIVPVEARLLLEAAVAPRDRDRVKVDQAARVRIMAGNVRTSEELQGIVEYVSADVVSEKDARTAYYQVRIGLHAPVDGKMPALTLQAGMPAEAFIHVASRTALDYLLQPLDEQLERSFVER